MLLEKKLDKKNRLCMRACVAQHVWPFKKSPTALICKSSPHT